MVMSLRNSILGHIFLNFYNYDINDLPVNNFYADNLKMYSLVNSIPDFQVLQEAFQYLNQFFNRF